MKPFYRNDSYKELYELLYANITYKEKRETLTQRKHGTVYVTGNQLETLYI